MYIQKTLAWNRLGVSEDAHYGKSLKFKRLKRPNMYTFVSFQSHLEVEKN